MGFRCELCDDFLCVFQLSRLCENCYKVRTIIKCYNSVKILDCLENNFIVDYENKTTFKKITKTKSTGSLSTLKEEQKNEIVATQTDESYYPSSNVIVATLTNDKKNLRNRNKKINNNEN